MARPPKLTPTQEALIRQRFGEGVEAADLAREFSVSKTKVYELVSGGAGVQSAPDPEPEDEDDAEAIDLHTLRDMLGKEARRLQREIRRLELAKDGPGVQRATRTLTTILTLASKFTKKELETPVGTWVTHEQMQVAAERARTRLHEMVANALRRKGAA